MDLTHRVNPNSYLTTTSAKMALAMENVLKPKFAPNGEYNEDKVKMIIRLQVQPWHAASTFTHEAALAVARVSPESFWPFSLAVSWPKEAVKD
jgi:hypothetical protein